MEKNILFQVTDWGKISASEHKGETGIAYWKTIQFEGLRIRFVEYSKNYKDTLKNPIILHPSSFKAFF